MGWEATRLRVSEREFFQYGDVAVLGESVGVVQVLAGLGLVDVELDVVDDAVAGERLVLL